MAIIYPNLENIERLKVSPTQGEWNLINYLGQSLDDSYEVFFNPFLDGDRPDIIILKENCSVIIIEIKDWNLKNYIVDKKNKWYLNYNQKNTPIKSPHSQVYRYKKNLYDLHLPVLGLSKLTNKNFFNLVNCFVYFFNSCKIDIEEIYRYPLSSIKEEQSNLNNCNEILFEKYEKQNNYLTTKKRAIERDKSISFGSDPNGLNNLLKKIKEKSKEHILFDSRIYDDFKRRLSPSEHTLKQGLLIQLDKKQLSLTESRPIEKKIKGVAGCGKTSILAQRAINAHRRHNKNVLILTFNITLKNLIRDKISDLLGKRDFETFEISNYHQFFLSQLNNTEQDVQDLVKKYGIEKLFYNDVFYGKNVIKYNSIFIDEIQDYESAWVKIIHDNFLHSEKGEMVLFGDEAQNIYQRTEGRASVIAQGFGRWEKLNRSYRTNIASPLNQLFKDFQQKFLANKYNDLDIFATSPTQISMGFHLLEYKTINEINWQKLVFDSIQGYIKNYNLHPNDIVILGSNIPLLMQLSDLWSEQEKTHCMFETFEELSACSGKEVHELKEYAQKGNLNTIIQANHESVEKLRRVKKNHFYSNSGLIKFSTIHSFKGLEEKTVFCLILADDSPELIYTSVTRSTENLIIFDISGKNICSDFFNKEIA